MFLDNKQIFSIIIELNLFMIYLFPYFQLKFISDTFT